jgi:hypothetical protein
LFHAQRVGQTLPKIQELAMKMTICDGMGHPMKPKHYATLDDNYELDLVDKITVFITMLLLVAGIVYATFGG